MPNNHIQTWQYAIVATGYAHAHWGDGHPIDPENGNEAERYASGEFNEQTKDDSLAMAADLGAPMFDPDMVRKAGYWDDIANTWRRLNTEVAA